MPCQVPVLLLKFIHQPLQLCLKIISHLDWFQKGLEDDHDL